MRNIKALFLLIILLSFSFLNIKAQKFKILTKAANVVDNKLVIDYGFTKSKQKQNFNVWLEIKNSTGEKLNVKAVSGDVGENIKGGENKQIIWDFLADNIVIDDNIGIEVKAELMIPEKTISNISTGKALLLSAVMPGLGIAKVKQKNSYLLLGAVTYGSVILSYINNKNANNNYNEYLSNNIPSSESDSYSKSNSQKTMSNVFAYTAITTWAVNMIWTLSAAKKSNSVVGLSDKNKVQFATGVNPYSRSPVFMLTYRF